jgi:hypothetical protein
VSPTVDHPAGPPNSPAVYTPQVLSAFDSQPESQSYGEYRSTGPDRYEMEPYQLDEIVDRVIQRIEQRVVDELERRGRRYTPGAF